jgi:hypothetical protein
VPEGPRATSEEVHQNLDEEKGGVADLRMKEKLEVGEVSKNLDDEK